MVYVRSRKFCCCLPVRFGVFCESLLGMAVGAATGAATGALSDVGVDDKFMKELGASLDGGHAAVIVLVRSATADKVVPEVSKFGGKIIQSSLSDEREAELQAALDRRGATV